MQLAHFVADEFITKPKSGCFGTAATPHSGKQKKDDRNQDRNSQPASLARSLHPAAKPQKPSNSTLDLGLVHEKPADTEFQQELAGGHHNIGNLLLTFGQPNEALEAYRQALAIRERLVLSNQTVSEYQFGLTSSYHAIGIVLSRIGQPHNALEAFEKALEISKALAQKNDSVTKYQFELADQYKSLGSLLHDMGQPTEAIEAYQQSLAIRKRLADENPTVTDIQDGLAESHHSISVMFYSMDKQEDALATCRQALAIRERLVKENPTFIRYQRNLAGDHAFVGYLLSQSGQTDEALQAYQKALSIRERLADENPTVENYQNDLAEAHYDIGDLQSRTGRSKKALAAFQKALAIQQRLAQENPEIPAYQGHVATTQNDIGLEHKEIGQRKEALEALQKALKTREHLASAHPEVTAYQSELGGTLNNIAMMDVDAGRYSDGCSKLIRAIKHQKQALAINPKHPMTRRFLKNHYMVASYAAMGLARTERWNDAAAFGQELIEQDPDDSMIWLRVAPLLLLADEQKFYSEFCERIVTRFAGTDDVEIAEKVCKACLLQPEAIDVAKLPRDLLIRPLDEGTVEDSFRPWGWATRALLACRDGDAELAVRYVKRSEECQPAVLAHALNLAVLSLARHQLHNDEPAQHALTELSHLIDGQKFKIGNFHDLLIAGILFREAEGRLAHPENMPNGSGGK